jgi:ABC-type transport system substrate-binding protein
LLIAALSAALIATACGASSSKGASGSGSSGGGGGNGDLPAHDGSAIIKATTEDFKLMDPVRNIDPCNVHAVSAIYDRLIRTTQKGDQVPGLATSWQSKDPTTFELKLRQNVKFQDGTPFNAAAVVAHIKRAKTDPRSTLTGPLSFVQDVTAPDDFTVDFKLSSPRAGILTSLLTGYAGMVPSPTAVQRLGEDYGVHEAVGAGPWKPTAFVPSQTLTLRSWDGYWDTKHRAFAGIDYSRAGSGQGEQIIPQQITSGQLNYASVKDSQIAQVKASGAKYVASPSNQYAEIFIDPAKAPFDKLEVRQAFEYAIDRKALNQALTGGAGEPAFQPISPDSWAHNNSIDSMYSFDPQKAKDLLTKAGLGSGLHLKVAMIQHEYYQRMAEAVQDMLKQSNIFIDLVPVNASQINAVLYSSKQFPIAITAYAGNDDPGLTLEQKFASTGTNNPSHVKTAGLDEALAKGAAATNQDERAKAYQEAVKIVMENALSVPMFFNAGVTLFTPNVKNVEVGKTTCAQGDFLDSPFVYIGS